MTPDARQELGAFLRRKRGLLAPEGAPGASPHRRRTPGLRREEVSVLSNVGLTWYTWLEQGRQINVSRQVVLAIARTLQLTAAEQAYVLQLAGHGGLDHDVSHHLPLNGQHVLDALSPAPAVAISWDWTVVGWNGAYQALFPGIEDVAVERRNLLWLVWADPAVRDLLPDWESESRRFLAMFRADVGSRIGAPEVADLVGDLREVSDDFAAAWDRRDVDGFESRARRFRHPAVGPLDLEQHQLSFVESPGIRILIYTASTGSPSAAALERLVADPRCSR